jgi:hypothetical protein
MAPVAPLVVVMAAALGAGLVVAGRLRRDTVPGRSHLVRVDAGAGHLLELAAGGFRPVASGAAAVSAAGARLATLEGVDAWRYEPFPFDSRLPRLVPGGWEVPGDEPGCASLATWTAADGLEVPVWVGGLQIGRFVLTGPISAELEWFQASRARAVGVAERLGSALAMRRRDETGGLSWPTSCC